MFRGGRGAPETVSGAAVSSIRAAASSPGLPMVAEARINTGEEPYRRQMRLSRRMTQAMWEPKTPR